MRFTHLLADEWYSRYLSEPAKAKAFDTTLRNSNAGTCSRSLWYDVNGYEREPMDEAGVWTTSLGTLLHQAWQEAVSLTYPTAAFEVPVRHGDLTSGHLDGLIIDDGGWRIVLELKTQGGTGFRHAVGARSGFKRKDAPLPEPNGPRHSAIRQLALNAYMADADEARLCLVAMEAVGKTHQEFSGFNRFCAEWAWERDEYTPLALAEIARFEKIAAATTLIAPEAEGKLISPPGSGSWECSYCAHQQQCLEDSE